MKNLRDSLRSLVPNWLSDKPGLNVGFAVLFTIALMCDCLIEVLFQGFAAALPGKGTPTALYLNGQSRGLIRGVTESNASYASRLVAWLDTWFQAGSDALLIQLLQIYLGGGLALRIVNRAGHFVSISTTGVITNVTDTSWNFDATELPARVTWWSDLWIIVYVTDGRWATYTSLSDPAWIARWGFYNNTPGGGIAVPAGTPAGIMSILHAFKGAHAWVEAIVFSTDAALFTPGSLGSTYPNGRWGNFSRPIAGVQSPARATISGGGVLRYMVPEGGG